MDPLTIAAGVATAAAAGAGWHWRRRARKAEAEVGRLRCELLTERHAASHDPLTGLPNRRAFYELGAALVADPQRLHLAAAVLDLDDFKQINDRYGHAAGDEVLVNVARRFATYAGDGLVARLGGDEFAALLVGATADERWLRQAGERLAVTVAAPMRVAESTVVVTASVGLVPVDRPADLADVLRHADAAMYRAKADRARMAVLGAAIGCHAVR
ncbi:MAG TPA: GGDEF domain-containing protein [Planosporangium sp.]|jgi:diguanylate cyclase (GGDEF)-like protein|nr:GGDEF domain-containing protein [Planosporangium sp.]